MASQQTEQSTTVSTAPPNLAQQSPWRRIFEDVRKSIGNKRDDTGVLGSINWLRKQMEHKGANPNVVRNIIYRDKGKINDKRALFEILNDLWTNNGNPPLQVPELEVLLSTSTSAEQEVMQLLGREKRRAYRTFVAGVRGDQFPKVLVTGRSGSGKTILTDYVQQALEMPPKAADEVIRLEFSRSDLAASLGRMARVLGIPNETVESRLVKIAASGAYAVQADAQADVARVICDYLRASEKSYAFMIHISQVSSSGEHEDSLGMAPLRLNTPEVPRVSSSEWLWVSLLTPLSRLPHISIMVTMIDVPSRIMASLGAFEGPIKLSPPTASEARRFVKARLPYLSSSQQESLVYRAKRSFEDLRTLTLLTEIREPLRKELGSDPQGSKHIHQLSHLVHSTADEKLRSFLGALAILSVSEFPEFSQEVLDELRGSDTPLTSLEQAFLDAVPGYSGLWRCFSRQLSGSLRKELQANNLARYREINLLASKCYRQGAEQQTRSDLAARYVYHLLEGRDWEGIEHWLRHANVQQSLLRRIWDIAGQELDGNLYENIALQVAAYYVKLGSHNHPDVVKALNALKQSEKAELRAWAQLKRAESEVIKGDYDAAETLVRHWPDIDDPTLNAEVTLVKASVARWRGQLKRAAELIEVGARQKLPVISQKSVSGELVHAKVSVWAGLIAKDQGDFHTAIDHFSNVQTGDDLIQARVAFQKGDVLMQLGHFDAAVESLQEAVALSKDSEAPVHEQVRYESRLASLHRRRGEFDAANTHFCNALERISHEDVPEIERSFEMAKVKDERAINQLAAGNYEGAIFELQNNISTFRQYQNIHEVDASFRILRSSIRLGIAYWCRGVGQVFHFPLVESIRHKEQHLDVRHARKLLDFALEQIKQKAVNHYGAVYGQAFLAASLINADPITARSQAQAAYEWSRFDYQKALCLAYTAYAFLREDDFKSTIETVQNAQTMLRTLGRDGSERGDMGLYTWLKLLSMKAYAGRGDVDRAKACLQEALERSQLSTHRYSLLKAFGAIVENGGRGEWLEPEFFESLGYKLSDVLTLEDIRLQDAIAALSKKDMSSSPLQPHHAP